MSNIFFPKCPKYGLDSEKTKKKFLTFSEIWGGGQPKVNVTKNLMIFFLKLEHYLGTLWKNVFAPFLSITCTQKFVITKMIQNGALRFGPSFPIFFIFINMVWNIPKCKENFVHPLMTIPFDLLKPSLNIFLKIVLSITFIPPIYQISF